jgi:hypothetical protein
MTPAAFDQTVVQPGLALLPEAQRSIEARGLLIAVGGVESRWSQRLQMAGGPAHGFFQCERESVAEVFQNSITRERLKSACASCDVSWDVDEIFLSIIGHNALSAAVARLILLPDRAPLPRLDQAAEAWAYYLRCWKPGKPDESRWPPVWIQSCNACTTFPVTQL